MMRRKPTDFWTAGLRLLRVHWLLASVIGVGLFVTLVGPSAWAASPGKVPNQTVPQPTATFTPAPIPTATPTRIPTATSKPSSRPNPTATPVPPPSAGTPPPPTATPAPGGHITAQVLNVRKGPGTDFGIVGKAYVDQQVRILGRNADATWWYICCAAGGQVQGWVSGQYVEINFPIEDAAQLVPATDSTAPPTPTPQPSPAATAVPSFSLQLQESYQPGLVWQGKQVTIQFAVTNPSGQDAIDVSLRDSLQPALILVSAQVDEEGEYFLETDDNGQAVVLFKWSRLAAGGTARASVVAEIAPETSNGAVIDNLAAASATNANASTAGISIGMPPAILPDFN